MKKILPSSTFYASANELIGNAYYCGNKEEFAFESNSIRLENALTHLLYANSPQPLTAMVLSQLCCPENKVFSPTDEVIVPNASINIDTIVQLARIIKQQNTMLQELQQTPESRIPNPEIVMN